MSAKTCKIVFVPSGKRSTSPKGTTILKAAQQAGIDIRSICGGNGYCHKCKVTLVYGDYAKYGISFNQSHLSELTKVEQDVLINDSQTRLSCQAKILDDLVVSIPEESLQHSSTIKKPSFTLNTKLNPLVKIYYCTLAEPDLANNQSDYQSLQSELAKQGISANLPSFMLPELQPLLKSCERKIALAIDDNGNILKLLNPEKVALYGVAIDIGSTTIAIYLYDLINGNLLVENSAMNPQISYGEDLMSRVSYVMMNKGSEQILAQVVRTKIEQLIKTAMQGLDIENLLQITLVGNPIMQNLFLGISPIPLGQAPFTLTTSFWTDIKTKDLNMKLNNYCQASFLPLIAGHVGADMAAVYLTQIDNIVTNKATLIVDIGTNAEIILAYKNRVVATSSPTGPAFEGAEISHGVRASTGAIERVRIDKESLQTKVKVIGSDFWSDDENFENNKTTGLCGSGIFEVIVELANAGLIDNSGLFQFDESNSRFSKNKNQVSQFLLYQDHNNSIFVEQTDIRAIQLAKAALFAGAKLLMDYLDCQKIDQVLVAGAFGVHLNPSYVASIGILPIDDNCDIKMIGNAAGMGAALTLMNREKKQQIIQEVQRIEKIESAIEPKFQEYFVSGMNFPTAKKSIVTNKRRRRRQ